MERLTKRLPGGAADYAVNMAKLMPHEKNAYRQKCVEALAAYEDTELDSEDFKKAFNEDAVVKLAAQALGTTPDRLRGLVEADNEWRVLPEKSMWTATCHGSKLVLVLDVEAAQEAAVAQSCQGCRESVTEKVCEDKRTGYVCPNKAAQREEGQDG